MAFSQRVVITTMMLVMAMPVFDDYHNDDDKVMSFPCLQINALVAFWQRRDPYSTYKCFRYLIVFDRFVIFKLKITNLSNT